VAAADLVGPARRTSKTGAVTGKILHQDLKTVREKGGLFQLPEGFGGDESLAATVAVQKLKARVLDDDLRARVDDFLSFCAYASTGWIGQHKNDPPELLEGIIDDLTSDIATRYPDLIDRLGAHIRGELGRS
jgi:hypothetical protein